MVRNPPRRVENVVPARSSSSETKRASNRPEAAAPIPADDLEKLDRAPRKTSWTDAELVEEAKEIIVRELVEAFKNDVKMRVVRGKVQEHLSVWEKTSNRTESRQPPLPPPPAPLDVKLEPAPPTVASVPSSKHVPEIHSEAHVPLATKTSAIPALKGGLGSLSFAKRQKKKENGSASRIRQSSTSRFSSEAPSETSGALHDLGDDEVSRLGKDRKKVGLASKSRRPAQVASESEDSEDERVEAERRKEERRKKKHDSSKTSKAKDRSTKKRRHVHLGYTSSEDEDEHTPDVAETPMLNFEDIVSRSTSPELNMQPVEVFRPAHEADPVKLEHDTKFEGSQPMEVDSNNVSRASSEQFGKRSDDEEEDEDAKPARPLSPSTVQANRARTAANLVPRSVTSDPFEAGVAADEEDLFYLKLALERLQLGYDFQPTPPSSDDEQGNAKHPSGSARTEGLYKITVEEKMANRPASNRAKAATENSAAAQQASAVAVSRLARANTRGLVRGMELHKKVTATDTDVLKFNQLKTRKKQLTFSRSGIEGYGLFAKE